MKDKTMKHSRINTFKRYIQSRVTHRFSEILSKVLMTFFTKLGGKNTMKIWMRCQIAK